MTNTLTGTINAVVLTRYKGTNFDQYDDSFKEALVKGKARILLIAAEGLSFEPAPLDVVTFDGADWIIVGITPLSPAGIPLIYTAGVMRK